MIKQQNKRMSSPSAALALFIGLIIIWSQESNSPGQIDWFKEAVGKKGRGGGGVPLAARDGDEYTTERSGQSPVWQQTLLPTCV